MSVSVDFYYPKPEGCIGEDHEVGYANYPSFIIGALKDVGFDICSFTGRSGEEIADAAEDAIDDIKEEITYLTAVYDPPNGWGTVRKSVENFLEPIINTGRCFPTARVSVSC